MRIHILADKIPWFGQHTGYEQLPRHLNADLRVVRSRTTRNQIRLGRAYKRVKGWPWREDDVYAAAELRFWLESLWAPADVRHILYGEGHHHYLEHWKQAPANLVATLHHPPEQWPQQHPLFLSNLRRLRSAIVLYRRDIEVFEQYVGAGRVHVILHGVDTEFFCPANEPVTYRTPRLLFAGQNGRNTDMLFRVITVLAQRHPDLVFDLLVRDTIRQRYRGLSQLTHHPAVRWHERISDDALRDLYRRSYLLLLPLDVCGATTAMVESLACGLPVVTTDVGGVPDYGGGSVYPIVANNDDEAMIELVERYLEQPSWRDDIAHRARAFAEQHLAWPLVAEQHLAVYRHLLAEEDPLS